MLVAVSYWKTEKPKHRADNLTCSSLLSLPCPLSPLSLPCLLLTVAIKLVLSLFYGKAPGPMRPPVGPDASGPG
jgi:hypothetical protein